MIQMSQYFAQHSTQQLREKVLVVDDEVGIRILLTRLLTSWGYRVRHVEDAVAALETMAAEPADILLSDVSMPEHDGLWLVEQVHATWPQTAVVMSTAHDDVLTVRASRRMGAVAYVTKPFVPYVVKQALEQAAHHRRSYGSKQARSTDLALP
jgi:DNA-binding NtrC family response regulator